LKKIQEAWHERVNNVFTIAKLLSDVNKKVGGANETALRSRGSAAAL
jgi:hypothetical protein